MITGNSSRAVHTIWRLPIAFAACADAQAGTAATSEPKCAKHHFSLELHHFHGSPPWLRLERRRGGRSAFNCRDISMSFYDGPENIEGIAFDIEFSLPVEFTLGDTVFDELEKLGLPRWAMAGLCDLAVRDGAVDAEIVARVLSIRPSEEDNDGQLH